MKLLSALNGINGEPEIQRVLGAFGTTVFVITGPALIWAGKVTASFEAFALAYPAGLAACIGATAGAIALKDRQIARAKVIERTGE